MASAQTGRFRSEIRADEALTAIAPIREVIELEGAPLQHAAMGSGGAAAREAPDYG